jgi:hypothetical protein
MTTISNANQPQVRDECSNFGAELNQDQLANLVSNYRFQDAMTQDNSAQQYGLSSQGLSSQPSPAEAREKTFLKIFCHTWAERHGYGAAEINRLAEILPYAKASLYGKLDFALSLEDIMHLWVAASLRQYVPEENIEEAEARDIARRLQGYSVNVCATILQQIQGPINKKKLLILIDYIRDYKLTNLWLEQLFALAMQIDEIILILHRSLFLGVLTEKFHYQEALSIAQKLYEKGWQISAIVALLQQFAIKAGDKIHDFQALEVLELINTYQHSDSTQENNNLAMIEIIKQHEPKDWVCEVAKQIISFEFSAVTKTMAGFSASYSSPEEDPITLFKTILNFNRNDIDIIKHILRYFGEIVIGFYDVNHAVKDLISSDKPINTWEASDIILWAQKARMPGSSVYLVEKLFVIRRAIFLAHGYMPRPVQLTSVAMLAYANKGMLAEIATGEGKSIITAMLAVMKILEGKKVDIVTSSSILAQRDAQEQAGFYQLFGITVAHNLERNIYKPCYEKDIVYGDVLNFVVDILNKDNKNLPIRGNRPLDLVIIDEVDSAFIDQSSHVTMLVRAISGFEHLEPILVGLWQQLKQINRHFAYDGDLQAWVWVEGQFEREEGRIKLVGEESYAYVVDDTIALAKKILKSYLEKLLAPGNMALHIPNHLKSFVYFQQDNWIDAAIKAQYYIEGKHYVLSMDEYKNAIISVVDYQNTGVVYEKNEWSNGLHQFLQIKHGIKIRPEHLMTKFMSNMAFFKGYQSGVYGMTGTLGAEEEKAFIKEMYQADFFKVPTYKPKKFIESPPIIKDTRSEWLIAILESLKKETTKGRAVLLILETINEVDQLEEILLDTGYAAEKVRVYSRNDRISDVQSRRVDIGDILLATNLAGRGTDLKTTPALEDNGGMHVCIGYLPNNLRVQLQAYGRTSRQGNQGTGQLIINAEIAIPQLQYTYPWYEPANNRYDLLHWRDLAEKERLLKDRYARNELAAIKDALFAHFLQTLNTFEQSSVSLSGVIEEVQQIEDLWGMWLKEQDALLDYPLTEKMQAQDIAIFQQRNANIKEEAFASLHIFTEKLIHDWNARNIIQNPAYFTSKAFTIVNFAPDSAITYLNQAKALDPIFSFTASYLQALASILNSDTAKQEAYDNLVEAKGKIQELLPQLEGMLAVLNFNAIENNESELSKQIINKMAIIHKLDEYIVRAAEVIAKSQPEEKIAVKSITRLREIMAWEDNYQDELQEFEDMGLIHLFDVQPFKEKKNWIGTMVSFVCGIVQICIGVLLAPVSGGMSTSLIVSGVGDIISSIKSVITGMPIDLKQYFSAKGIEYAVIFLAAAFSSMKEAMTGAKEVGAKAAAGETTKQITREAILEGVKKEVIKRGIITGIGYVAEAVLDKGLENYEQDIENSVKKDVSHLINQHANVLEIALFFDEISGNSVLQNGIHSHAIGLLKKYQAKYHTAAAGLIKGIGENVASRIHPAGAVAFKFMDIGHSISRINEVTRDFNSQFSQHLSNEAHKWTLPDEVMRKRLAHFFSEAQINDLMHKMVAYKVIENHRVVNCNGLSRESIKEYTHRIELILDTCFAVEKAVKSDKQARLEALKNRLTDLIASSIIRMIKGEVLNPLASMVGMWGGEKLFTSMQHAQDEVIARFNEENRRQARYLTDRAPPPEQEPTPQTEHLFDFSAQDEIQVAHYAEEVLHHQGGLLDVEILSKVGKINLHLSIDDVYEGSAYGGIDHNAPEIHLNYDSATNKWQAYDAANNQIKIADSVYTAIASYTDTAASTLRETVKYYIHTNPSEVATLLNMYDEMIAIPEADIALQESTTVAKKASDLNPSVNNPISTPQSNKGSTSKINNLDNPEHISSSKPPENDPSIYFNAKQLFDKIQNCGSNTVCRIHTAGSAYSNLLQSRQAMEACTSRICLENIAKLYEQPDPLSEPTSGYYSVEAAAIKAVKQAYASGASHAEHVLRQHPEWQTNEEKVIFAEQAENLRKLKRSEEIALEAASILPWGRAIKGAIGAGKTIHSLYKWLARPKMGADGKIISKPNSIEDFARQWKDPGIKPTQFEIAIQGKRFKADSNMDPNGVPVIVGASDKQVKNYAFELMQSIGAKEFPKVTSPKGKGEFYAYKNPETKVSITLRSESKSADSTGARWTIDINNHPSFPTKPGRPDKPIKAEIKFR